MCSEQSSKELIPARRLVSGLCPDGPIDNRSAGCQPALQHFGIGILRAFRSPPT